MEPIKYNGVKNQKQGHIKTVLASERWGVSSMKSVPSAVFSGTSSKWLRKLVNEKSEI